MVGFAGLGDSVRAAEELPPLPSDSPIPVVPGPAAVQTALDRAKRTGQALMADLSSGHDGQLVRAPSAGPLPPGRYRLHALVASTPHDHILVDAVALRMAAGQSATTFERQNQFPAPGELTPVFLDFSVADRGPVAISVDWFVGDTQLDRQRYRDDNQARQVYRAQRQNAINQYILKRQSRGGIVPAPDSETETLGLEDDSAAQRPRYRPRPLTAKDRAPFRLLLTGMVIETLTPVDILGLYTDKPAYDAGETGRGTTVLVNRADVPVDVQLQWRVRDDSRPEELLLATTETVHLDPRQELRRTLGKRFSTATIGLLGNLQVSANVGNRRDVCRTVPFVILPAPRKAYEQEKRIFAHYMACWPIAYGALPWERRHEGNGLKHESRDEKIRRGGHLRNYALGPADLSLTPEDSADLEIRRALRIGIDGFAIDAWAGGQNAMKTFAALIRTAGAKDYPFEVTVCIDSACGGNLVDTVKWLLERYGDHPKLARRDGKPLVFGYFSQGPAWRYADHKLGAQTDAEKLAVRTSPLGWHLAGAAFRHARQKVGKPVFYHFSYEYLFHPYKDIPDETLIAAVGVIARHVDAVGSFGHTGRLGPQMAEAVKHSGAEWSGAIGMYQKENIPFEVYAPLGSEWLEGAWNGIRSQNATLLQLITWNDYGENTNIAPAWETRYALYDLTGYHIEWWKTGKQPAANHDRVYVIYAKYPREAQVWPFAQGVARPRKLEVLTILPEPGVIRLPGRNIEFKAPAGYSRKQFPLTVGPVIAELLRDGNVVTRIESPEPITDRPFRESNGLVCCSSEFKRHWQTDFGTAKPLLYGEYADDDNDGLPNWYEMYWFTKERGFKPVVSEDADDLLDEPNEQPVTRWLDLKTVTLIDPEADPDGDGKSNLQEYLQRTDPTLGQ